MSDSNLGLVISPDILMERKAVYLTSEHSALFLNHDHIFHLAINGRQLYGACQRLLKKKKTVLAGCAPVSLI
jgi:hypothetical protein